MKNKTSIVLRHFTESDFVDYQTWYANETINKELGPMDNEWLEYVLSHQNIHQQYAAILENELIAVVGVHLADTKHKFHYITDFCVNPKFWQQGIGRHVLVKLLNLPELQHCRQWALGIAPSNKAAQFFFTKLGWKVKQISDNEDLIEYVMSLDNI